MKPGIQKAQPHVAHFGVCLAGVLPDQRRTEIELCYPVKAQGAFTDIALVLGWVKFDVHALIVVTGLALVSTIQNAALRFWLATPSRWGRGTIHTKAKAPVLKNTFSEAVAAPTDKRGFVTPNLWSWCACTASLFWSVVGVIRKDARTASDVFLTTTLHPMRVRTLTVALVPPEGAKTMTATTPTTGTAHALNFEAVNTTTSEAQAFALLQAASDAAMAKLYLSRGNIPAARRKAVQLLKALQAMEVAA